MKYGKKRFFRKTHRKTYRTSRKGRLSSRIRGKKRFERRLNSVAEKKMRLSFGGLEMVSSASAGVLAYGVIKHTIPAEGTDSYEKIGSKYFLRYVTIRIAIANVSAENMLIGKLAFLELHERNAGTNSIQVNQIFGGNHGPDSLDKTYLKTNYKKIKVKYYNMTGPPDPAGHTFGPSTNSSGWNILIKRRYKIMQNIKTNKALTEAVVPDILIAVVYFPAPYSGKVGNPAMSITHTLSWTDV